jgi:hypothetical protein
MIDFCCDLLWKGNESLKMRMTYWYILESFPLIGRAPTMAEMETDLFMSRLQIQTILQALSKKGVLRLDGTSSRILDAYPYSSIPTRHRMCLDNGMEIFSMCAVDAFYVPFLTESDIIVRSHCFFCRSDIEIAIEQKRISRASPSKSMIWNSMAEYTCPLTNFFCSEEHFLKWRKRMPNEPGQVFTLADSLEKGKKAVKSMKQAIHGLNKILWSKSDDIVCFCRVVSKAAIVAAIDSGILSLEGIAKETTACTGSWCEDINPMKRCCSVEIKALIEAYSE